MTDHLPAAMPSMGVVAITGASSGIGRATAALFARKGWRVGLIARGAEQLDAARAEVVAEGGTALVQVADVTDSAALTAAADAIEAALGPIDVWVNNAGVGIYGRFLDIPEAEFRQLTDINYFGVVNGTRVALTRMQARGRGTIVQVASTISYRAVPLQSPYSGSKYAIRGFTEAVRSELIADRSAVHLTMVHPPAVNTPFYPHAQSHMPRPVRPPPPIYQPEIVADAIHLAATTRRREVMVGGSTVAFALANKVAPGLMDQLAGRFGVQTQQSNQDGAVALRDPNLMQAGTTGGTHGPFDAESLGVCPQMWAERNRTVAWAGIGLAVAGLALAIRPPRLPRAPGAQSLMQVLAAGAMLGGRLLARR